MLHTKYRSILEQKASVHSGSSARLFFPPANHQGIMLGLDQQEIQCGWPAMRALFLSSTTRNTIYFLQQENSSTKTLFAGIPAPPQSSDRHHIVRII